MIIVGGATRLTDSGLSITEWRPVTGAIPPLTEAGWEVELEKYRQIPEYQEQNRGMSMAEFQFIYWWEWGHRQLGRTLVKRAGGRRMYRRQDVLLLKGLRRLLYDDGYTIKGAQKYLREHGVAAVAALADAETPSPDPAQDIPVAQAAVQAPLKPMP